MFLLVYLYSVQEHKCSDSSQIATGTLGHCPRGKKDQILSWGRSLQLCCSKSQSCLLKYFGADDLASIRRDKKLCKSAMLDT